VRLQKEGDFKFLDCGPECSMAISEGGHVYTWGHGEGGKLGHQDNNDKKLPTKISALLEKKVPGGTGSCGFDHLLLLTAAAEYGEIGREFGVTISSGLPMSMGANTMGQLGLDDNNGRGQWTPQILDKKLRNNVEGSIDAKSGSGLFEGSQVQQVAAGMYYSLFLAGGKVYSCGQGDAGQLGVQKPADDPNRPKFIPMRFHVFAPQVIEPLSGIKQISAGPNYALALGTDGTVYSWGNNEIGQLGHGDEKERQFPTEVEELSGKGVKKVVAGERHWLALCDDGTVYACGSCRDGQLGIGMYAKQSRPKQVAGLEGMQDIAAAGNVSWAWKNLSAKGPERKKRAAPEGGEVAEPAAKKAKKAPAKKAPAKKKK